MTNIYIINFHAFFKRKILLVFNIKKQEHIYFQIIKSLIKVYFIHKDLLHCTVSFMSCIQSSDMKFTLYPTDNSPVSLSLINKVGGVTIAGSAYNI